MKPLRALVLLGCLVLAPARLTASAIRVKWALVLLGCLALSRVFAAGPPAAAPTLFQAIRAGDAGRAETLMQEAAALNARDDHGNTPLISAAWMADVAVLERLLNAGADVNDRNKAGATALLRAATFADKARLLVSRGADVKARSKLGNTALILAARKPGNSQTVKLLLEQGAKAEARNVFGTSALMAAAAAGDLASVRLLLDAGADINATPNLDVDGFILGGGRTPLMWAAFLGAEPLVKLLLERGAKVDAFTQTGGALTQAAWGGHAGAARLLLEAGAPVDQRDLIANYTPLHWAASTEWSAPELTELLLAHRADVNAEGGQPVDNFLGVTQTPLMLARKRGATPVVQVLLSAGAKSPAPAAPEGRAREKPQAQAETRTVAGAVQHALPALTRTAEDSAAAFARHASRQQCTSCHQQQLPLAALSLARSRHFPVDAAVMQHQLELLRRDLADPEISLQGVMLPDPAIFAGYVARDMLGAGEPASPATDAMVHMLVTFQHPDGHWSRYIPRPPVQGSDITATASALRMIRYYGIPSRRREMEASVQRARAWLLNARAETNEERTHQLLGLAWAGSGADTLQAPAQDLVQQQRKDGGWAQLAGLESDAYATGQSLYALMAAAGRAPADPAVRRGLDFLRRSQLADGTWHVRSRTHPFQPPMDSGFPHGRDGWISAAGSSWAVIALATSLDPAQPPPLAAPVMAKVQAKAEVQAVAMTPDAAKPGLEVDFIRDIQPMLERSCLSCHSGARPRGGLVMTSRSALLHGGSRGEAAILPGQADASPLLRCVQDQVEDLEMPPLAKRGMYPSLTPEETARLRTWIQHGARWPGHVTLRAPRP